VASPGKSMGALLAENKGLRRRLSEAAAQIEALEKFRQVEAALRESEERYRRLFEDDLTGDYVATPDGKILACNPAFVAILGFVSRQEALDTNMVSLYPDRRERENFVRLLSERRKLEYYECVRRRIGGELIHVVENAVGVFDERGELEQIRGYLFDNTAHKLAEQALREAEERYRSLVELLPDAILVSDGDIVLFGNPAAARLMGVARPEDLVGRSLLEFFSAEYHAAIAERSRRVIAEGLPSPPEHRKIVRADGQLIDVETAATPIRFGGTPCVLRVNRDITARIQAEGAILKKDREISLQLQKIEKLNTALTTLLERREEEGRQKMEGVRATLDQLVLPYLENLKATRLDDEQRILAEVMQANLSNIASSFARQLSTWKTKLTPTEVQVADLLRLGKRTKEIAALLKVSPSAIAFHRTNIRTKLGLTKKPMNLVSYLRVIAQ
jgi:PAS domain S-box-containing protein